MTAAEEARATPNAETENENETATGRHGRRPTETREEAHRRNPTGDPTPHQSRPKTEDTTRRAEARSRRAAARATAKVLIVFFIMSLSSPFNDCGVLSCLIVHAIRVPCGNFRVHASSNYIPLANLPFTVLKLFPN